MTTPHQPSFPEYQPSDLTADARAHLLGAMDAAKQAHELLLRGEVAKAMVHLDKMVVLAQEARKPLLGAGKGQNLASAPAADTGQEEML